MKKIIFCIVLLYSNLIYSKPQQSAKPDTYFFLAPICDGGCYYGDENDHGYGDGPNPTNTLYEYSLETERIFNRNFVERPAQKDISNFVEQLDRKLSSGETLRSYSSYSLDKILNVVRANNEREEANLKEDLNALKNEIQIELKSSIETSKDFADIHNQEVKDYVAALPFLEQALREQNFKNSSPKVKETAFYSNYVAQTIKAEDQFLKDAADRVIQRADKLAQDGQQEASEKALAQANNLLDNALSPNLVPAKEWRSNSEAKEIINDLHQKISKVRPSSSDQALAKDVALAALDEADEASVNEDHELFERNLELAKVGLDIALGFIPVANIGQSLYEAITGRSVITGEELGTFGQAMAILGIATLGASKTFQSSLKAISKIAAKALAFSSPASINRFKEASAFSYTLIEGAEKAGAKTNEMVQDFAATVKMLSTNDTQAVISIEKLIEPAIELGNKTDFLLGRATGSAHNIERSQAMLKQFERIGLFDNSATRTLIKEHLAETLKEPTSIAKQLDAGRVLRESLISGPNGHLKIESIWEGNKLITAIIKG